PQSMEPESTILSIELRDRTFRGTKIALSESKNKFIFDFAERSYLLGRSPKNSVKREAKTKVMSIFAADAL
ncbi:MAG: hypothetical protein WCZ67_07850, partial [Bacteroidales bacterium]